MTTLLTMLLAALALATFAIRLEPGDDARTPAQIATAIRTARWGQRVLWLIYLIELPLWVAFAAVRTGLYLAVTATAWAACQAANVLVSARPIHLCRAPKEVWA